MAIASGHRMAGAKSCCPSFKRFLLVKPKKPQLMTVWQPTRSSC
jgi:hypothetical protein